MWLLLLAVVGCLAVRELMVAGCVLLLCKVWLCTSHSRTCTSARQVTTRENNQAQHTGYWCQPHLWVSWKRMHAGRQAQQLLEKPQAPLH